MAAIRRRGRLIAGVDQNTLLLGYANPLHGQRIEGFEIDLLHELSRALFGRPNRIDYHALTTAERLSAVQNGTVDIVVDAFTITCYRATQGQLLVGLPLGRAAGARAVRFARAVAERPARQARLRDAELDLDRRADKYPGVIPYPRHPAHRLPRRPAAR